MKRVLWLWIVFSITGCGIRGTPAPRGRTNDPQLGESFVPAEPEATRYAPSIVNGEIVVDIGIPLHVSPVVVAENQVLRFINPPEQATGISWTIDYDPEYLRAKDPQSLTHSSPEGWVFQAIKPGRTHIQLRNKNPYFTSCDRTYRNFCPEQDTYVIDYRLSIQ